jgi:hypothetical protein
MSHVFTLVAVVLIALGSPRIALAEPTTAPTSRPAEVRAEHELAQQMEKLESDYRAKKADVLKRYVALLTAEKGVALRKGDREEAQRLFDSISSANAQIAQLVPPTSFALKRPLLFSIKISMAPRVLRTL